MSVVNVQVHLDSHFQSLKRTLETFSQSSTLTNVTLISGSKRVSAHRVVLSTFTSFYDEIIHNDHSSEFLIILNDMKDTMLDKVMEFIYGGTVFILENDFNEFYETLNTFKFNNVIATHSSDMRIVSLENFEDVFLDNLWSSRTVSQSDVIFITDGSIQTCGHSVILSSKSKYLLNLFTKQKVRKKPYICVIENVANEHLEIVIEFCYKGTISIRQEMLRKIYEVAHLLGIEQLCEKILSMDTTIDVLPKSVNCSTEIISTIRSTRNTLLQDTSCKNLISNIMKGEHLVDLSIVVENSIYKTHLSILCEYSPYFRDLTKNCKEIKDSFVLLKDLNKKHVQSFIDYLYKGETEFLGSTKDFCMVMSDWIDFELLPIDESVERQILGARGPVAIQEDAMQLLDGCEASTNVENLLGTDAAQHDPLTSDGDGDTCLEENNDCQSRPKKKIRRKYNKTCFTCNQTFSKHKEFREHLLVHPEAKIMKCEYCNKGFDKRSQLDMHVRIHTLEKPYHCLDCRKTFTTKSTLSKHSLIHNDDNPKFLCDVCSKEFSRKEYLVEHKRTHSGAKPYKCGKCTKSFVGRTGLNHHLKTHDLEESKRTSVCEICGKSYSRHALWTHMKTHDKTSKCTICQRSFATGTALKAHITGSHLKQRNHQCDICGKGFILKTHLIRHLKKVCLGKDKKTFSCSDCFDSFVTKSKLQSHVKREHRKKNVPSHRCEICEKTFVRPDALSRHKLSHHEESLESVLERDEKQTSGLTCSDCNVSFKTIKQLKIHSRSHVKKNYYRCEIGVCTKMFRWEKSLKKHIDTHYPISTSELPSIYSFRVCEPSYQVTTNNFASNSTYIHTGHVEQDPIFIVPCGDPTNVTYTDEQLPHCTSRRPFTINIDGNLCCNTDGKLDGLPHDNISVMPPLLVQELELHELQPSIPLESIMNEADIEPTPGAMIAVAMGEMMATQTSDNYSFTDNQLS